MRNVIALLLFSFIATFGAHAAPSDPPAPKPKQSQQAAQPKAQKKPIAIRGNRNSGIYHMPSGCPSYNKIAPRNIVPFKSEAEARNAGYRKAKNCR